MKYLLVICMLFSQLTYSQDDPVCLKRYQSWGKQINSKTDKGDDFFRSFYTVVGFIFYMSGLIYATEGPAYKKGNIRENTFLKNRQDLRKAQTIFATSGGLALGGLATQILRKKSLRKKKRDLRKVMKFMESATMARGDLFDEVFKEIQKKYPYLYEEELAEIAFQSFTAPEPNSFCPQNGPLKYKQFIKLLEREVGLAQNMK